MTSKLFETLESRRLCAAQYTLTALPNVTGVHDFPFLSEHLKSYGYIDDLVPGKASRNGQAAAGTTARTAMKRLRHTRSRA